MREMISELISTEKVAFKKHCVLRMRQRAISVHEFKEVMLCSEIVEYYENDYPLASVLILGFTSSRRPLHAVVAVDHESDLLWVITLYEPTTKMWDENFKRRRV